MYPTNAICGQFIGIWGYFSHHTVFGSNEDYLASRYLKWSITNIKFSGTAWI